MKTWKDVKKLLAYCENQGHTIGEFRTLLGWEFRDVSFSPGSKKFPVLRPAKTMSAAARKKISAAQKLRWAKVRAGKK